MTSTPESFEDLYLKAPFGYLSTDLEGEITQVNETLARWLGMTRERLLGTVFADLLDKGGRLFYETRQLPVLLLQGRVQEVALTLVRADGSALAVLVNSEIVIDGAGAPTGVRTALLDSSERQQYERILLDARRRAEVSESRMRVLQTSASSFIAADSELEVAEQLAERAIEAFDASSAAVFLPDADGVLRPVAGTVHAANPGDPVLLAFSSGQPVRISNLQEAEERFPQLLDQMHESRTDAFIAIPMVNDTQVLGVLLCRFGRARTFDEASAELQSALALQAGQVIVRLRLQAELRRMARHDPLTGQANRQWLHERTENAVAVAIRTGRPLAIVFFDLDGFKDVNDELGHAVGDNVLRQVSDRLNAAVRVTDFTARFGGDEFVVVCEDTDADSAAAVAERIRASIGEPIEGVGLPITASVGVVALPSAAIGAIDVDELLERADAAMYLSKSNGRDRVTIDRG